jgi:hypothetical protein
LSTEKQKKNSTAHTIIEEEEEEEKNALKQNKTNMLCAITSQLRDTYILFD